VFIEDFPIRRVLFWPDGSMAIAARRRKFFYSFDLVKDVELVYTPDNEGDPKGVRYTSKFQVNGKIACI
jgi:hypothetical protein